MYRKLAACDSSGFGSSGSLPLRMRSIAATSVANRAVSPLSPAPVGVEELSLRSGHKTPGPRRSSAASMGTALSETTSTSKRSLREGRGRRPAVVQFVKLSALRQAVPEKKDHLLEGRMLSQIVNVVPAVEDALFPVNVADAARRGDHVAQTGALCPRLKWMLVSS